MEQAQSGQVSGQLESLIQQAIQAGIPPQQILPILSQLQNPPGGMGGLSAQCLPTGGGSSAAQTVANQALHSAHQSSLGGIHGLQALSQQPASIAAAVAQMSAGQPTQQTVQQQPQISAQTPSQLPPGAVSSSLPWPIFQPIVSVPHFDMATYEKVNLDVQPSALPNGQDLPLNDVNTLRFFFNFGVQHARAILLRQHLQSQNANMAQNPHLLSFLQNPDTALTIQQHLLRAQQQAALLTGQRPGERSNLSQTTAQVPQNIPGLPGNLSMNSLQNTLAQHLARSFAPAPSSFKPISAPSNDPLETLLQSALLGTNPSAAAQIKAAMASQSQGNFAVPAQPLAHHLAAQQQLVSQAQHLEQLQHDLMRPHAINPALIGSHAASSAAISSTGQTMINTLASATSGTQTSHSNGGGGGQVAVSPKNLPIPADPVPRKSSSAQGIQDQIYELQQRGLMALRSPNNMNEQLQKQIAAAASALTAGQSIAAAQNTITNSTAPIHGHVTTTTVPVTSMPSLAAQLSAAMLGSTVFMPSSGMTMTNINTQGLPLASHAGLPTVTGPNATRSLTSGSSGHHSSHGTPTSTPTTASITNTSGIGIANIPITVAATSIRAPPASSPSVPLEVDGAPTILAASEIHYSETFKKTQGLPVHGNRKSASPRPMSGGNESRRKSGLYSIMNTESKDDLKKSHASEKPQVSTMINYVNSYISQAKSQLQAQGVGLHMDPSGRPIDYSSRPIDPIFRKAREKLEDVRAYHDTETPSTAQPGSTTNSGANTSPTEGEANPRCLIGISGKQSENKQSPIGETKQGTKKDESIDIGELKKEENLTGEGQKRDAYSYEIESPEEKRLRIASTDDEGEM